MTQSYFIGGGSDVSHRTSHRMPSVGSYFERPSPYGYHDHLTEYSERHATHKMIHEPDADAAGAQNRRRIAVACARCRKRKIRCSGDPGDGSGCQACRVSGTGIEKCVFNRVGSSTLTIQDSDDATTTIPMRISQPPSHGMDTFPDPAMSTPNYSYHLHPKTSLPLLQTRSTCPGEYEAQYRDAPVDGYAYTPDSNMRHDSFSTIRSLPEGFRMDSSTIPISMSASRLYDPSACPQPLVGRLPSVATDNISPLNMSSLQASLPPQTAQERRVRLPPMAHEFTGQRTQSLSQALPDIRAMDPQAEYRPYFNNMPSRSAMQWSTREDTSSSRANSFSATTSTLPLSQNPMPMSEVMGYPYPQLTSLSNPRDAYSDSSSASMLAPAYVLPSASPTSARANSTQHEPISLYSFSSDTGERPDARERGSEDVFTPQHRTYPSLMLRHPQPRHKKRHEPFEQSQEQRGRAARGG